MCPCAHCMYAMYMLGIVAYNPAAHRSTWRGVHYVDLGNTNSYNEEVVEDVFDP